MASLLALTLFWAPVSSRSQGKSAGTKATEPALPSALIGSQRLKAQEEAIREQMLSISRQLGVRCTACHNLKNFASDEKPAFLVSKEHLRITQLLIDAGMDGKQGRPKADCYMCHRGELKPKAYDPLTVKGLTNDEILAK